MITAISGHPCCRWAGFNPDELAPGDACIIHYGLDGGTRAEFVCRTRYSDWSIVLRWNPYECRYARVPVRLHSRTFISHADAGEASHAA